MSVVAIHPRTHSSAASPRPGPARTGPSRRRPSSVGDAPVLRVTVDVPLLGERLTPELSVLLELVRDLVDRGEGVVAVTGLTGPASSRDGQTGAEPVAVVDALARGTAAAGPVGAEPLSPLRYGPVAVDPDDTRTLRVLTGPRVVLRGGLPVPFTRLEFDLLVFLARHPRRVFTRLQLLTNVWGYEHAVARTVDVHVRRVRAKAGPGIPLVTTVHGVGYRLADDAPIRIDDSDGGHGVDADVWGPGVSLL